LADEQLRGDPGIVLRSTTSRATWSSRSVNDSMPGAVALRTVTLRRLL